MTETRRRWLLFLLIVSGVLNYADRQIIAVLKPMLQQDLHWTDVDYGNITSLFQLATACAYLGAGRLVDWLGWRRANTWAVGTWSLAAMSHALARTVGQFATARVALGITESLGTPAAVKTVAVLFVARTRSLALGAMNAASNLGAIFTALAVPPLALAAGWAPAFLIVGALGLLWVMAWVWVTGGEEPQLVAPAALEVAPRQTRSRSTWRELLRDRGTWAVIGAKMLSDQVWWFLLFWVPDFFHTVFHLDMSQFAAPVAVIYAAAAGGSVLGGMASGRLIAAGREPVLARKLTMLVCALLVTPLPFALASGDPWVAVALLSLTLAAHQGFATNLFALATDVTPSARVGTLISIAALGGNIAGIAILQAAGWLIGGGYGYRPLFMVAAFSYLAGLLWLQLVLPRETRTHAEAQ
jgi:ACS family hexuronate transporter-like MFS transporter